MSTRFRFWVLILVVTVVGVLGYGLTTQVKPAFAQTCVDSDGDTGICKPVCDPYVDKPSAPACSGSSLPPLKCCVPIRPTPIPCDTGNPLLSPACTFKEIPKAVAWVLNYTIIGGAVLAVLMVLMSGYYYITSQDDPNKREKAIKTFQWAIIGLVFAASAFIIVTFMARIFQIEVSGIGPPKAYAQEDEPLVQILGQVRAEQGKKILPAVEVSLYSLSDGNWVLWPAQQYRNQRNPYYTDSFGQFQFYVPAGEYYLTASKESYFEEKTDLFMVESSLVKKDFELQSAPSVWIFLLIVGVPIFIGMIAYIIIKRLLLWQKKQILRRLTLKKIQKETPSQSENG